ncbi:hypothetical protein DICVIV_04468 [Dictyocaulus viviparus]|uniref:BMERB domain-containing protein n=1 Tax=Dictyocaulus viviparus TaxID=29172 RepID=A0A0D8XY16_DICVI|nr:hypothetical protein DICVIV_04468 [Dictyocaulus viviparus]
MHERVRFRVRFGRRARRLCYSLKCVIFLFKLKGRVLQGAVVLGTEDESVTEDENDDLEEEDLDELEKTVLQFTEENPEQPLTENQLQNDVFSSTERLNCSDTRNSIADKAHALNISKKNTSKETFPSIPKCLTANDIRKKKSADLERLRTLCRLKARLKTDEELGLNEKKSVSHVKLTTGSCRYTLSLSPVEDELKVNLSEMSIKDEKDMPDETQLPLCVGSSHLSCPDSAKDNQVDPENGRMLDSWLALVHERELVMSKEEMLRLSKREVELEVEYRDLIMRFKGLGEGVDENLVENSELLAKMLNIVEERKQVCELSENAKQSYKKANLTLKSLMKKGRNFKNFMPVFSS